MAMHTKGVACCLAVLGALTLGCDRKPPNPGDEDSCWEPCKTPECNEVSRSVGNTPAIWKGSRFEIRNFGPDCDLDVSWSLLNPPLQFRAAIAVFASQVFPLREGLAQVFQCRGELQGHGPPIQAFAVVGDPGPSVLPALALGDVFIPLEGYASLEGDYATAQAADPFPERRPPFESVDVAVEAGPMPTERKYYPRLREGDSFHWADREAKIARLVRVNRRCALPTGWVEVSLGPSRDGGG